MCGSVSRILSPCLYLHVTTVLRIRPSNPDDAAVPPRYRQVVLQPASSTEVRLSVDAATLAGQASASGTNNGKKPASFAFDHVLPESSSQVDLFGVTAVDVIDEFMKGHNVAFLA